LPGLFPFQKPKPENRKVDGFFITLFEENLAMNAQDKKALRQLEAESKNAWDALTDEETEQALDDFISDVLALPAAYLPLHEGFGAHR
jgi:maltooligosyltrehalose synthase